MTKNYILEGNDKSINQLAKIIANRRNLLPLIEQKLNLKKSGKNRKKLSAQRLLILSLSRKYEISY